MHIYYNTSLNIFFENYIFKKYLNYYFEFSQFITSQQSNKKKNYFEKRAILINVSESS